MPGSILVATHVGKSAFVPSTKSHRALRWLGHVGPEPGLVREGRMSSTHLRVECAWNAREMRFIAIARAFPANKCALYH